MKAIDFLTALILAAMCFSVLGAFFDVITSREAVMMLVVFGVPLTVANKLHLI